MKRIILVLALVLGSWTSVYAQPDFQCNDVNCVGTATDTPFAIIQNGVKVMRFDTVAGLPTITLLNGASNVFTGQSLAPNGTALLPSYAFAVEPSLGFYRSAPGSVGLSGGLLATGNVQAGFSAALYWATRAVMRSPAIGVVNIATFNETIGSQLKVDALPTIASGFGTSPAITAGSTPLAGSVNWGTGGVATLGVITFGGTAFPSIPFCTVAGNSAASSTSNVYTVTATTTNLTLQAWAAPTASTITTWICISSK